MLVNYTFGRRVGAISAPLWIFLDRRVTGVVCLRFSRVLLVNGERDLQFEVRPIYIFHLLRWVMSVCLIRASRFNLVLIPLSVARVDVAVTGNYFLLPG